MVLVVGATGRVGMHTIPLLISKGVAVRAMTRTPEKAKALAALGAEVVRGDLRDRESITRACAGVEKVLATAHGFTPGQPNNNLHTVDDVGNRNLIDTAKAAGIKRFVFISVLGAAPASPMELSRIKYATEQYLQASGLTFVILRAAPFMEFWATMVGEPILKTGKTTIFGSGKNPINFVSVEDVAKFAMTALEDAKAQNKVIEVGGPENLTFNEVADLFERASARRTRRNHVPLPMMRVARALLRPFNPMLGLQITGGILMDTVNMSYDMGATLQQYPSRLIRLEEIVRRMVESAKPVMQK